MAELQAEGLAEKWLYNTPSNNKPSKVNAELGSPSNESPKLGTLRPKGAQSWALTQGPSCPQLCSRLLKDMLRASQSERRIAQPQLKIVYSWLKVKQQVLGSGNGNGIW